MDGHNFVSSGHVEHISFLKIPEDWTIVFGKVKHSQKAKGLPLRSWVLVKDSGKKLPLQGGWKLRAHLMKIPGFLRHLKVLEPCEIRQSNFKSSDKLFEMLLKK